MNCSVAAVYRWFESDGLWIAIDEASGRWREDLDMTSVPTDEVQDLLDALLLADHDPLLQCIDASCKQSFNWRPASIASVMTTSEAGEGAASADKDTRPAPLHQQSELPRLTMSLASTQGQARTVFMAIPADESLTMPELPAQWQELVAIQPHVVECLVNLQQGASDATEWVSLKPGALVLLDQAFSDSWAISLHPVSAVNASDVFFTDVKGSLSTQHNAVGLLPPELTQMQSQEQEQEKQQEQQEQQEQEQEQDNEYQLEIRLELPVLVNQLYIQSAWQSGLNVTASLAEPFSGAGATVHCHNRCANETQSLRGRVVAIGRGYGVLLDEATQ